MSHGVIARASGGGTPHATPVHADVPSPKDTPALVHLRITPCGVPVEVLEVAVHVAHDQRHTLDVVVLQVRHGTRHHQLGKQRQEVPVARCSAFGSQVSNGRGCTTR